ncbi:MAG: helix-turn-helix domain-containing protein [Solirubrobacteraceae bacterium]
MRSKGRAREHDSPSRRTAAARPGAAQEAVGSGAGPEADSRCSRLHAASICPSRQSPQWAYTKVMIVDPEPTYLTVRETARRLGVHENTIRNWARDGTLVSARLPGAKFHRFDERDVERLRRQRGEAVSTIEVERRTIGPELINASELALWARTASRDAQGAFPELMRRLLASTPGVTNISLRIGDGVALPGWDGRARSVGAGFLPDGDLCFEFGVNQQSKTKADHDYESRKSAADAQDLIFIFATPRRWRDAHSWAEERRRQRIFRDVRVLDADDIEGWLRATPLVHYWISERLGRRPRDAETLERWWARFREQTDPELPGSLFIAGRDVARDKLAQFVDQGPDAIVVQSAWRDDAVAFIAATLDWLAEDRGEAIDPLVVTAAEVWDRLTATNRSMVLIPLFEDPEIEAAVRRGHQVIVPVGPDQTVRGTKLALDPPHRNLARQSLESAGLSFERAYELSARARRNMPSLIRELARDRRLRDPEWAQPEAARILAPLILIGSWSTEHHEDPVVASYEDLTVVSSMVGECWEVVERALKHWLRRDDRPFIRTGETQWHLASPEEAFLTLHTQLTSGDLRRWRTLAPQVLLELDPVLELDPDEQYMAGVQGIRRSYSAVLRRGIADGVALVGSLGSQSLGDSSSGEDEARRVVGVILAAAQSDDSGRTWRSLSDVLPLLAEAAPYTFLDAVLDDLGTESPLLRTMFQDGDRSSWLTSSSPHTGLLWALETLCWSGEYLGQASLALARLQTVDPGGRLGNRPLGSLQSVFPGWTRHTAASLAEKVAAIEQICQRVPDVGWKLVLNIWPSQHAAVMPPHSPQHSDWAPNSRSVSVAEWVDYIGSLVRLAIAMAGDDAGRWGELAQHIAPLPPDDRGRVIEALEVFSLTHDFSEKEQLDLWEQLHTEIARHRQFKDADWSMDEDTLDRLDAIATRLEPEQNVERFAYLFDWRPDLPDIDRHDFAAQEERVHELRVAAVQATIDADGAEGLRALTVRAKVAHFLGWVIGEVAPDELTSELASWLDSDEAKLQNVAANWARQRTSRPDGLAWFRRLLTTSELEPKSRRAVLVLNMPAQSKFWDALADADPELAEEYWRSVHIVGVPSEDVARSIDELLSRDRPWVAIDLIAGELHHPDPRGRTLTREHAERALDAAMRSSAADASSQTIGYEIGVVLDFLEARGADGAKLAAYEFVFFRLIEHHREPRALFRELGTNPDTYVDLVSRVYRGKNEPERKPDEQEVALAHQAWWVLAHWSGIPGLDSAGVVDEDHLASWVDRARLAFAESDRADIGDEQIGQVLSNSPPGSDGIWPAEPVRTIIEQTVNKNIESGLIVGRMNSRGPTTRGVFDGGQQERGLSVQYREWSRTTASSWPRTSRLLRLLADSYEQQARRQDARAEIDSDTG